MPKFPCDKITVVQQYDGWVINIGDKSYCWTHNEEDLGVSSIVSMLGDLGYTVRLIGEY